MIGIKINKIAAVWLLMAVFVCISKASKPGLTRECAGVAVSLSSLPKLNEVFTVYAKVIGREGLEKYPSYFPTYEFIAVFCYSPKGAVKILDKSEVYIPELRNGWTKEIKCRMQIVRPEVNIHIGCRLYDIRSYPIGPGTQVGGGIEIFLLDSLTGQYGTREEYERRLPVEYRYDPLVGTFTCSPSQNPAPVEENRAIIKMIKQLAPTLNDSLALVLHSEQYKVGIPRGLPQWDSINQRWQEKAIFEYYLNDGWLKALQENKLEAWREKEKQKILKEYKEQKSQFFRDNDSGGVGGSGYLVNKTFYGHWHYKNHYYNKDQGLLSAAKRDTVKQCRARCLIRYNEGSNVYYSYFNQKCITDDSGYFFITINVNPTSWTKCRIYPVLFPCGPDLNNPMINVSDPNITIPAFWKDPEDPTLYPMREDGTGQIRPFTPDTNTLALGAVWTDTFPLYTQPHSGCINIYETYLHARTFMNPPPSWPLRVIWEPGYDSATAYRNDTIWIHGDTTDTDEWDDDVFA